MADSDDDYDNSVSKRRGKFRKEREDTHVNNNEDYKRHDRSFNDRESSRYTRGHHGHRRERSPTPKNSRDYSPRRSSNRNQYFNRSISPPVAPSRNRYYTGSRDHHGSRPAHEDLGYKRYISPPSSHYYKQPGYDQSFQNYSSLGRPRSPISSSYYHESSQKKLRRAWDLLDDMPKPVNYFEHDNRAEYDDYARDKINDDYNRSNYPAMSIPFRNDRHDLPSHHNNYIPDPMKGYSQYSSPMVQNDYYNTNNGNFNDTYMSRNGYGQPYSGGMSGYGGINYFQHISNAHMVNNSFNGGSSGVNREYNGNNFNKLQNDRSNFDGIGETQPQMFSFKQFLSNLNSELDSDPTGQVKTISPEIATKRYNEYKNRFRCEQIGVFFSVHKAELWFKQRYHPDESAKRKDEQRMAIKRRLEIFMDLKERFNGMLSLDMSSNESQVYLYKFLDACMIRLENGTNEDLDILNQIYDQKEENSNNKDKNELTAEKNSDKESGVESNSDSETGEEKNEDQESSKFSRKRKKTKSKSDNQTDEIDIPNNEKEFNGDSTSKNETEKTDETNKLNHKVKSSINIPQKTQSIFFKHLPVNVTRQDLEEIGSKHEGFKRASISEPAPERRFQRRGWITFSSIVNIKDICSRINGTKLYNMNLNATINRELDQKVKCIIGLTNHKVIVHKDLKLISRIVDNMDKRWGLWQYRDEYSNNKLKDEDFMTDTDKKKLKNKKEKELEVNDVEMSFNEIKSDNEGEIKNENSVIEKVLNQVYEINPFLKSADAYLKKLNEITNEPADSSKESEPIEDSQNGPEKSKKLTNSDSKSAESPKKEKECSPAKSETKTSSSRNLKLERDEEAAILLDTLILYLRIVHSIDFYNATEYQQEDWMPNRCGILHVRGSIEHKSSLNSNVISILNGTNINYFDPLSIKKVQLEEWMRLFEINVRSYYEYRDRIDQEIANRLGVKDLATEIEKYIKKNTQKVEKDIWLCPISGKKFKGADYVKKHIETKFKHKLLEVRKDVEFFNRFVYDPKRPYLPEHPFTKTIGQSNNNSFPEGHRNNSYQMQQGGQYNHLSRNYYNDGHGSSYPSHSGYLMMPGYPNQPLNSYHSNSNGFKNHSRRF